MVLYSAKSIKMIAIDLGSNSLRVVEIECQEKIFLSSFNTVVKTADKLNITGEIAKDTVKRIISKLNEAKELIDFDNKPIRAITTEAMRQAKNSDAVLEAIKESTDISFEIISGEEEAMLTLLAVKHRLQTLPLQSKDSFVLVDIGGASTELIYHYEHKTITKSFPIGIVTISQEYHTLTQIAQALPIVMESMQEFAKEVTTLYGQPLSFVATAGTPTTIASMKLGQTFATYDPKVINGTTLTNNELEFYLQKLLSMSLEERELTVGTGRADLITAGVLIFAQLFRVTNFEKAIIIDDGLREGVALEWCHREMRC